MSWRSLPGWFDWPWLYEAEAARARPGAVMVEVGVYLGRSLAFLVDQLKDRHDVEVWGVDDWALCQDMPASGGARWEGWGGDSWEGMPGDPRKHVASKGGPFNAFVDGMAVQATSALERVHLARCSSARAARLHDDRSVDLCYIDADHSYGGCSADIRAWLPKMRPGGMLAGHDHTDGYPGVKRAVAEMLGGEAETRGATWFYRLPTQWGPR